MTLSSMTLVILAVTMQTGPVAEHWRMLAKERNLLLEPALFLYGKEALQVFGGSGVAGLENLTANLENSTGVRLFFFDGGGQAVSGLKAPQPVSDLVKEVLKDGRSHSAGDGKLFLIAIPLTTQGGHRYVVAGEWSVFPPRPPRPWYFLSLGFRLRLLVSLVIGGIICYGLAWHLTAPIRRLRKATHQLATGDLSARVGACLGNRKDEMAGLSRDFDRMAERIELLVCSQQRLIRDISHELRSPLARLNVALELARRSSGTEATGPLNRIERESERLNDLIAQLVTLTLLESGSERLEKHRINLSALVREIADDADYEARNINRSVRVLVSNEVDVYGSEEMLHRAIENVLRNALRYTAEGTMVEIALNLLQKDDGPHAVIRVRDHGPGVPEAALTELFRPFYRVADARDRLTGGTGIGLTITERAVHLHGGVVTASNAQGGGLVVEIDLPGAGRVHLSHSVSSDNVV